MNNQNIDHVIILGGGTAGWLTAAKLAKHFNSSAPGSVNVTLVESPNVPTIGVGEGTWPTMRKTLAELGINENEFITKCNASFKQGTKFVNWKLGPDKGKNNHYYHMFSSVVEAGDFNLSPYWILKDGPAPYADCISAQAALCEKGLAPKLITNRCYEGIQNYAYHLDAGKFAELLKTFSCETLGVKHISADVDEVVLDEDGFIQGLYTASHGRLDADFFVDCSGFSCLLLDKTYNIPFKPIHNTLLTDHAIAIQVPYSQDNPKIESATVSTGQTAGWIWDIGLSSRRGTGHVYCSDFIDHDTAEQQLRAYIGPTAEHLDARLIKMRCGYRQKFWHKNCVAVGLSAAFVEPLEASAIFLVEAAANMLCDQFPRHRSLLPSVERKFNQSFQFRWDKTIEFIKLHYYLSQRDEPFWQANRELDTVPDALLEKLEHWRHHPVSRYDFSHVFEPFPQDSFQYVLHGMGFEHQLQYASNSYNETQRAEQYFAMTEKLRQQLLSQMPSNIDLLKKVSEFGFQPV